MTEQQAARRGYYLSRGGYYGTSDDRADRWYVVPIAGTTIDRRGSGYVTKKDALAALAYRLEQEEALR